MTTNEEERMRQSVFLRPDQLGITGHEFTALCNLLNDLEAGELRDFDMGQWDKCFAGQCDSRYGTAFVYSERDGGKIPHRPIAELFLGDPATVFMLSPQSEQRVAARVLRHWLTTREVDWKIGNPYLWSRNARKTSSRDLPAEQPYYRSRSPEIDATYLRELLRDNREVMPERVRELIEA